MKGSTVNQVFEELLRAFLGSLDRYLVPCCLLTLAIEAAGRLQGEDECRQVEVRDTGRLEAL